MTDLPDADPPPADLLDQIVVDAVAQADELIGLDAVRAEAWASDLAALALEAGEDGIERLVVALSRLGGRSAAAAVLALDAVVPGLAVPSASALEPAPPWAAVLGTSAVEGAAVLRARRGESAVFRFVDAADDHHVVVVDLVPAGVEDGREQVGEIAVGPGDLLAVIEEDEAGIQKTEQPATELAERVAAAMRSTERPRPSAVANGRLLVARLTALGIEPPPPPVWVDEEIPPLPSRDDEDDTYARDVLRQALGDPTEPDPQALVEAAALLRRSALADAPLARWLAASAGPVDLDESDRDVVLAALAAAVVPSLLVPLEPDARQAVLDLEWADWLGAVIGLVREGPGATVDPDALVDHVNRCPEVTSTIPKKDRPRVAWAFAVCTEPWSVLGLAVEGLLTPFGAAILPAVLDRAWS